MPSRTLSSAMEGRMLVRRDFNTSVLEWSMPHLDFRRKLIFEMTAKTGSIVINTGFPQTFRHSDCEGSIPSGRMVSFEKLLVNHLSVHFFEVVAAISLCVSARCSPRAWHVGKVNIKRSGRALWALVSADNLQCFHTLADTQTWWTIYVLVHGGNCELRMIIISAVWYQTLSHGRNHASQWQHTNRLKRGGASLYRSKVRYWQNLIDANGKVNGDRWGLGYICSPALCIPYGMTTTAWQALRIVHFSPWNTTKTPRFNGIPEKGYKLTFHHRLLIGPFNICMKEEILSLKGGGWVE